MTQTTPEHLILYRSYTPRGTFGQLTIGELKLHTLELPWRSNVPRVSCIPEGVYTLRLRTSDVVKRTSGGAFTEGWEVQDVPNRTHIMIHPGNTIDDIQGCIVPGMRTGIVEDRTGHMQWAVVQSRPAFGLLMQALAQRDSWTLDIRTYMPESP